LIYNDLNKDNYGTKLQVKKCLCDDSTCAKCLSINCEDKGMPGSYEREETGLAKELGRR